MLITSRWLKRVVIFVIVFSLIFIVVYASTSYLEKKIVAKIESLGGSVTSVQVGLFTRSIHVNNLRFDSTSNGQANIPRLLLKRISVEGIRLIPFLRHKHLVVSNILLDSGNIFYTIPGKKDSTKTDTQAIARIQLGNLSMRNLQFKVIKDTITTFAGYANGNLKEIVIDQDSVQEIRYAYKEVDFALDTLEFKPAGGEYVISIQRVALNTSKRSVRLDSLLVIPQYGKFEFANRLGEQKGRLNVSVPALVINGWQWEETMKKSFIAQSITIESFDLYSFKDKRLPFLRTENLPLPMESFIKLKWLVKLDSLIINNSNITIETLSEEGVESGIITFNQLNAELVGLNNRWEQGQNKDAVLKASASFMNSGFIRAQFTLPQDGSPTYMAKGSISKLDLLVLNEALTNMANVRFASGYLEDLSFEFGYTDLQSKGRLDMAYQDLRIVSLDKNKASTNELKTLLIRVFMNRDKHKSAPLSKAIGVIDIERDRKKYVFNTWWKSILGGIQSSILGNMKMPERKKAS